MDMPEEQPGQEPEDPNEQDFNEPGEYLEHYAAAVEEGSTEDANAAMAGFQEALQEWHAGQAPTDYDRWLGEAERHADNRDWDRCIAALRFAAEHLGPGLAFRPRQLLVNLYQWLERHAEALDAARVMVATCGERDSDTLCAMAYEYLAGCLLRAGQPEAAVAACQQAAQLLTPGRMADPIRVRIHALEAACHLAQDKPAEARAALEPASAKVQQQAAMGSAMGMAPFWTATARLRALTGDQAGALEAWRQAVEANRATVASFMDPGRIIQNLRERALANSLSCLAEALRAEGRLVDAEEAAAESRAIRIALGLPPEAPAP